MSSTPEAPIPDERLLAAHDLALAALREITPEATIGAPAGYTVEDDGVVSLLFETRLAGYPGWYWTVSLAVVEDAEPTVLEAELLPGDGALLAPEWIPWAVRLAEYQAQQAALAHAEPEAGDGDELDADDDADLDDDELDDDLDDEDLGDEDDLDEELDDELADASRLHAGDVDGVDIDELDDSEPDDDEPDDDEADETDDDGEPYDEGERTP